MLWNWWSWPTDCVEDGLIPLIWRYARKPTALTIKRVANKDENRVGRSVAPSILEWRSMLRECATSFRRPIQQARTTTRLATSQSGVYRFFWQFMSLWLGIFLFLQSPVAAQVNQVRRVLILDDLGTISSPGFAEVGLAVFLGLQ